MSTVTLDRLKALAAAVPPDMVDDLLMEIGQKDRVMVRVDRASRRPGFRTIHRTSMNEEGMLRAFPPMLLVKDQLRVMAGLKPRYLDEVIRMMGGELVSVTPNLRTTLGIDYVADSLGNNGSRPAVAQWMALSENAAAPAAGDTTLTGEITSGTDTGLARVIATYAHSIAATNYTLAKTFTAAATHTALQKEAIFNASSAGTMVLENTFTSTAMAISDQITITHTVNI